MCVRVWLAAGAQLTGEARRRWAATGTGTETGRQRQGRGWAGRGRRTGGRAGQGRGGRARRGDGDGDGRRRGGDEGLCDEAWKAIYQYAFALAHGAGNETLYFGDWIRVPGVAICSCNDGLRPVIFKLEATKEPSALDYTPVR